MYKFVLTDRDKTFVFDFTFPDDETILVEGSNSTCRYVKYELYRNDHPDKIWFWEGALCVNQKETFQLTYADQIDIKGWLRLYQDGNEDYVFMDCHYGYKYEEHFEGNVMLIPEGIPIDPIPIDPVDPIDPADDPAMEDMIISGDYDDLFPYLYLRRWPDLKAQDQSFFMLYELPSSPPTANFYSSLLLFFNSDGSPLPNARVDILQQAYLFVNDAPPYTGQYLESIKDLPFPYNLFPRFYNEIQLLDLVKPIGWESFLYEVFLKNKEEIIEEIDPNQYASIKDQLWQNVFALSIINTYNEKGLEDYIKSLLVFHILDAVLFSSSHIEWSDMQKLIEASVVLPQPVFPLPLFDDQNYNTESIKGSIIPYAIGDLQMIQHKLLAYRAGEVAHIENVLPGELKEVSNSTLQETQEHTSESTESVRESEDQWHGNLESLSNEIDKTIDQTQNQTDNYDQLKISYGPPTTGEYSGSVSYDETLSNTDKNTGLQFAKQILNKTIARMAQKLNVSYQKNQIHRKEEATTHTLDNRTGKTPIRGVYSWVNKIYSARVVNYGNRFLLEFLIDKPALNVADELDLAEGLIPLTELSPPIQSFEDITLENYSSLAAQYGVQNVAIPPVQQKTVYTFFNEDKALTAQMLQIPEAYVPITAEVSYQTQNDLQLIVGDQIISLNQGENSANASSLCHCTEDLTKMYEPDCEVLSIPVVLSAIVAYTSPPESSDYFISVGLSCAPSLRIMNTWKREVYDALIKAQEKNKGQAVQLLQAPAKINRQIPKEWVNLEVIQSCQNLLYQVHLKKATPAEPVLSPPATEVNKPAFYEFFNSSMEWTEATYAFSDKNAPALIERISLSLLGNELGNTAAEYLESDMLRVMVPIQPNFNYRMLYFLQTGLISYISDSITPVTENTEIIAACLKTAEKGEAKTATLSRESWEIVVPTNMQWLQDKNTLPTYNSKL